MTLKGLTVIFLPSIKFGSFFQTLSSPTFFIFIPTIGIVFLHLKGTFYDWGVSILTQSQKRAK